MEKLLVILCSTGGPKALRYLLSKLPNNLMTPVLIVQHMPTGFTDSLSKRLNEISPLRVIEANEGDLLENNVVYLAKAGAHMTIAKSPSGYRIKEDYSEAVNNLRPYGDKLLYSLCNTDYDEIICTVLTGMGSDGTKGIEELSKHKKTYVIAQDKNTSTVFGMPKSVIDSGHADYVGDLDEIAMQIIRKVGVQ